MNELLGFMVLSGPLFPALMWLVITTILVLVAVRPAGDFRRRASIKLLAFVVILVLPFSDEIVGHLYLRYLCETQGGFKVYKTVELPAKYWDRSGNPIFITFSRFDKYKKNGVMNPAMLPEYEVDFKTEKYSSLFKIKKFRFWYLEKETKNILAEYKSFSYAGGWLKNIFYSAGGPSCSDAKQPDNTEQILSIFTPQLKSDEGG